KGRGPQRRGRARPLLQRPLPPREYLLPPRREGPVQRQDEEPGRQPRGGRDVHELAAEPQGRRRETGRNDLSTRPYTDRQSEGGAFRRRGSGGSQRDAHTRVPEAVRGAGEGVKRRRSDSFTSSPSAASRSG